MKKFLSTLAVAAAVTFSASALDWYVCGAFQGWDAGAAPQMTEQEDGTFVLEVASIQSGFKIINARGWGQGEWGAPSAADKVVLGEAFTLTNDGGKDIAFRDYEVINNAKLVLDPEKTTLTVTGTPNTDNPALWLPGSYSPSNWNTPGEGSATPEFVENNGVYTLTTTFAGEFECKVCGSGWSPQWGFYAADAPVLSDSNNSAILDKKEGNDPGNIKCNFTGEYKVTFNIETCEIVFTSTSGIAATAASSEAPVFYNMQGVRVENPTEGLYIRVQGNEITKVIKK